MGDARADSGKRASWHHAHRTATVVCLLAVCLCSIVLTGGCAARRPVRIGVMMPLSGPSDKDADEVLRWAAESLNAKGGIGGRPLELIFKDTARGDIQAIATEFLQDRDVQVVIGPNSSANSLGVAPRFIEAGKLLISPTATSGELFRAFGKKGFFWRTCQSDVAQVRTIVQVLESRGVERASLIYENSSYGRTFSEWMGFFCLESGIELTAVAEVEPNSAGHREVMALALSADPEYVVCAVFPEDAVTLKRELDASGSAAAIMLTDAAETQYLLDEIGDASEGVELVSPAADPASGFEDAYEAEFGYRPWDSSAPTYDAFYLAVTALARDARVRGRQGIDISLAEVTSGTGVVCTWDRLDRAVEGILAGDLPDIDGASGPLRFDVEFGVDPLRTHYALNRVETMDGVRDFRTIDVIDSDESRGYGVLEANASAGRTKASAALARPLLATEDSSEALSPRDDAWAVIVSSSSGWENYRHQADAFALYDLLRSNGFEDDRIILFSEDDAADDERNPDPGEMRTTPDGADVRAAVPVDYRGSAVTVANLEAVLSGEPSPAARQVLASGRGSDVLVFLVGHGEPGALRFDGDSTEPVLSRERLGDIVRRMHAAGRYRRLLLVVETCFGESLVSGIGSPGVASLTGASASERSFATNYDPRSGAWLADDFTAQFLRVAGAAGDPALGDLYTSVYSRVTGSHVRLLTTNGFGDIHTARMSAFLSP